MSPAALYVIVEGECTEPALYRVWFPLILEGYREVRRIEDAAPGTFFLVAGYGYPSYIQRIRAAIQDLALPESRFTHLFVAVDAEERSWETRQAEVAQAIDACSRPACPVPWRVIIADCCVETWLLGNRRIVRRNPESLELRRLLKLYNVVERDPERMPNFGPRTRARFHLHYLREILRERTQGRSSYGKARPGPTADPSYFAELVERTRGSTDGAPDLRSFADLLGIPEWIAGGSGG